LVYRLKYGKFKRAAGQAIVPGREVTAAIGDKTASLSFLPTEALLKRDACPDCGGTVEHADGCVVCRGCGYTEWG
jgi:uncharacterized Zn finger protein (UPF0148 family)